MLCTNDLKLPPGVSSHSLGIADKIYKYYIVTRDVIRDVYKDTDLFFSYIILLLCLWDD